jgi:membrane-associated phospholipid phosphatase
MSSLGRCCGEKELVRRVHAGRLDALGRPRVQARVCALVLLVSLLAAGCGRLPDGRRWADDVTAAPGWERVGRAAHGAASEPETWVPAVAALVVLLFGDDANISGWAVDHTPLFGSPEGAARASDVLAGTAYAAAVLSAGAAPSGERAGPWFADKLKGFAVEAVTLAANDGTTLLVKRGTRRERPDRSNRQSFPSAHTSGAAASAALTVRNIEACTRSPWAIATSRFAADTLVALTGWARVEAGRHYPSDVLAGAALGHFIGAFMHGAFLREGQPHEVAAVVQPSSDGTTVGVYVSF